MAPLRKQMARCITDYKGTEWHAGSSQPKPPAPMPTALGTGWGWGSLFLDPSTSSPLPLSNPPPPLNLRSRPLTCLSFDCIYQFTKRPQIPDTPPVLPKNKNPPSLLEKLLKIREREPRTDWQPTGTKGILWRPSSESNCGQATSISSQLFTNRKCNSI